MKEWLEEMEPDVGVVQNTKLEPKTETYEGYLPLEMNDARNNNVSWFCFSVFFSCVRRKRERSYHKMIGVDGCR